MDVELAGVWVVWMEYAMVADLVCSLVAEKAVRKDFPMECLKASMLAIEKVELTV